MLIFDLESDGLLPELTKLHCLWIYNTQTKRFQGFDKQDVPKGLDLLAKADIICGHNILTFDTPAIQKVHPEWASTGELRDTLVWSRTVFPDLKGIDYGLYQKGQLPGQFIGRHSLEAWGYRLGILKGSFAKQTDWQYWSPEMSTYCKKDVEVTKALVDYLESLTPSFAALELEQKVALILDRQKAHGFYFNIQQAEELYETLAIKKAELSFPIQEAFPPFYMKKGKGEFIPKADNKRFGYVAGCPMTKVELTEFNPQSGIHIALVLKRKYGWKPTEFTATGLAKVDEDVLTDLEKKKGWPELRPLIDYLTIDKRMSQLHDGKQGWLKKVDKETSRIHGSIIHNGAVTGRMTHKEPNLGQVPANYHPYGKECRDLFTVPEGYVLVGCDADGIEGRCLGHYLARYDGGAYIKTILEGKKEDGTDMHNMNRKALEIESRDDAKTWFYAWMYGAGNQKLAKILKCSVAEAKRKNQKFLDNLPAMKKLKADIEKAVKTKGYLRGLDGRHLTSRSPHSALNLLLQSAGALIMKKGLVILDDKLQADGLVPGVDYEFVANVHDEWQHEVLNQDGKPDQVGKTAAWAIEQAGIAFNFRCPLAGSYDIGNSWAETH